MYTVNLLIYTLPFLFPIMQPDTSIKDLTSSFKQLEPMLLVKGTLAEPVEVYVVAEKTIICQSSGDRAPLSLLASFYVFNLAYPVNMSNLYTILEHIIFDITPKKLSIVSTRVLSIID